MKRPKIRRTTPALKPVKDQSIVITGASSGIGLETARRAADRGARVFLIARNEEALKEVCGEIAAAGGEADYYAADMGVEEQAESAANAAIALMGGFDTWVNCAGVSIYQNLEDVSDADHRRLFDTVYFGVVHGSQVAVRHLKTKSDGGALINIGSVLSDMSAPVQGAYSAAKHAVKGYTNALRMELMDAPVSVTLIKPSSIDTPFASHAKNTLERAARVPPPVYKPEAVANAILAAASHRHREITVGLGGAVMSAAANLTPRLADRVYAATMRNLMQSRSEAAGSEDSLHQPSTDGRTRGQHRSVVPASPYTQFQTSKTGRIVAAVGGVALTALMARRYAMHAKTLVDWARKDRAPMKKTKHAFFG